MLEWKKAERFRSKTRMPASWLILIPILYLITNTAVQYWSSPSLEKESLDAIPGRRSILSIDDGYDREETENCTKPAVLDFPRIKFPGGEIGRLVVPLAVSIYFYIILARICDDYFIDSIRIICSKIGFSGDVAGATLMAAATSSPELFVHMVGTFITEGNIGIGTIVGSAVFNVLALPGLCGIFSITNKVIELDVWPLVRDSIMYCFSLVILYFVLRDSRIYWYEAGIMVLAYVIYIILMSNNKALRARFEEWIFNISPTPNPWENNATWPLLKTKEGRENEHVEHAEEGIEHDLVEEDDEEGPHLCCWPNGTNFIGKAWWTFTWPITAVLACTIPNCRKESRRRFYAITFTMCLCWIAISSYMIAWMITITGYVMKIPDSVMGLTFIAAGMCIPETISSIIVAKQGHGSMALATSLGSNVFDMLFCFGLPWLIKSTYFMSPTATGHYIEVDARGLNYDTIILFTTIALLLAALALNKLVLNRTVGYACLVMYIIFISFSVFVELDIFDVGDLPPCSID